MSTVRGTTAALSATVLAVAGVAVVAPAAHAAGVSVDDTPDQAPLVVDPDYFGETETAARTFDVAATGTVQDVTITVDFYKVNGPCSDPGSSSAWAREMQLELESPTGTTRVLVGEYASGFVHYYQPYSPTERVTVTFDDSAATQVTAGSTEGPRSGTFRPAQSLDAFDGEAAQGAWTLRISDHGRLDETCYYGATLDLDVDEDLTPVIEPAAGLEGPVGEPFSHQLTALNDPTSFALTSGDLPDGIVLDTDTGEISGTPTEHGDFTFSVAGTNAAGTGAPQDFTLTIGTAPTLTGPATLTIAEDEDLSIDLLDFDAGHPATTIVAEPPGLPTGVFLDATEGALFGDADNGTAGTYDVVFVADTGFGEPARHTVQITVEPAPVVALSLDPASTTVDQHESVTFTWSGEDAFGGQVEPAPGTVVLASNGGGDAVDGATVTFGDPGIRLIRATHTPTGVQTFAQVDVTALVPATLTGDAAATADAGAPFTYAPTFDAGYPATGTVSLASGALPAGLALDAATGEISGTPTEAGAFDVTLAASNGVGVPAQLDLELTVAPGELDALILTPSAMSVDEGGSVEFTAAGEDEFGNAVPVDDADLVLSSSLPTDEVSGTTVTFPTASPHTITATHTPTGVTAAVTVEVDPDEPVDDPDAGSHAEQPEGDGQEGATPDGDELAATGAQGGVLAQVSAASALLLLGAGVLIARRRQVV